MKENFWEAMIVILIFAMSGIESCPLLIIPIAVLWAIASYELRDAEI